MSRQKRIHLRRKLHHIRPDGAPDFFQVHDVVSVDHLIAPASDQRPRYLWMPGAELQGEPLDGLADDHQLVQYGELCLGVLQESRLIQAGRELDHEPGSPGDVRECRVIACYK